METVEELDSRVHHLLMQLFQRSPKDPKSPIIFSEIVECWQKIAKLEPTDDNLQMASYVERSYQHYYGHCHA